MVFLVVSGLVIMETVAIMHIGTKDIKECNLVMLEAKLNLLGSMLKCRTSWVAFSKILVVPHAGSARQTEPKRSQ